MKDRSFAVFKYLQKHGNWQLNWPQMWATATGKRSDCGSVQFSPMYISSPVDWTCEHYWACFFSLTVALLEARLMMASIMSRNRGLSANLFFNTVKSGCSTTWYRSCTNPVTSSQFGVTINSLPSPGTLSVPSYFLLTPSVMFIFLGICRMSTILWASTPSLHHAYVALSLLLIECRVMLGNLFPPPQGSHIWCLRTCRRSTSTWWTQAGRACTSLRMTRSVFMQWYVLHRDEHESAQNAKEGSSALGKTLKHLTLTHQHTHTHTITISVQEFGAFDIEKYHLCSQESQ